MRTRSVRTHHSAAALRVAVSTDRRSVTGSGVPAHGRTRAASAPSERPPPLRPVPADPIAMFIGVLQFSMAVPHAESLKDKRSVVRSLKDRLRREFNIAIAETGDLDDWNTATLGAVTVGSDVAYLNGLLDKLVDRLEEWRDAVLEDHQLEIIRPR